MTFPTHTPGRNINTSIALTHWHVSHLLTGPCDSHIGQQCSHMPWFLPDLTSSQQSATVNISIPTIEQWRFPPTPLVGISTSVSHWHTDMPHTYSPIPVTHTPVNTALTCPSFLRLWPVVSKLPHSTSPSLAWRGPDVTRRWWPISSPLLTPIIVKQGEQKDV